MSVEADAGRLPFLRSVELLSGLAEDDLRGLADALTERTLVAHEVLFRQGEEPRALSIVREGALSLLVEDASGSRALRSVGPGDYVGETALLSATPPAVTARAEAPTRLLEVSAPAFAELMAARPGLRRVFAALLERSLPWLRAVITILFGRLDDDLRLEIEASMSWVHLSRCEVLFRRGDPGDALYVILQGKLHAVREGPTGAREVVAEMGRGEPVGEIALLSGRTRTLTVLAARDTDLVRLSKEGFEALVERHPRALLSLVRTLATRLETGSSGRSWAAPTRTVAVVPLEPGLPMTWLLDRLETAIGEARAVRVLDAERFDAVHGPGAARTAPDQRRQLHLAAWLTRLEADHETVVYACDPQPTLWSERCLKQADEVLLVARGAAPPRPGPFAPLLAEPTLARVPRELVLLHPDGTRPPAGTAAWMEATGAHRHQHVRLDRGEDVRRLARFLSGRAVGVVFGGGGARAFAHAGVARALHESGVPIDFVGGVSVGAVVAAALAMGLDHAAIRTALRRIFVDTLPWRYSLPLVSVFSAAKGERALRQAFGDTTIEDLWTNCFCVATSLTRAEARVLRRGLLWRALRAGGSYPGLVPPVPEKGELLVDGGLMTSVPVDVMRQLCPGPVIACDVSRDVELAVEPSLTLCPSPWRLLLDRLRPRAERAAFPSVGAILLRSIACREVADKEGRRRAASLYLAPPVGRFDLLDVQSLDVIADAGYVYAMQRLRESADAIPREPAASVA